MPKGGKNQNPEPNWLSVERMKAEAAERYRADMHELERCRCKRPIPTRVYLGRQLCVCGRFAG